MKTFNLTFSNLKCSSGSEEKHGKPQISKKRIRRNDKFQLINKIRKTRVRTFIKKVESFIEKKDKKNAQLAFVEAQPEMHRSVTKGVFKRNTISRKLSRLSNKIKSLK